MDPTQTLAEIFLAELPSEEYNLDTLCSSLQEWLERGGFQPDWEDYPRATRIYFNWCIAHKRFPHIPIGTKTV